MPGNQVSHLASALAGKVVDLAAGWAGREESSSYTQMQSLSAKEWEGGGVPAALQFWWSRGCRSLPETGHVSSAAFFSCEQRGVCASCWLVLFTAR